MQRKNHILNKTPKKRNAFAMIIAIVVIVILSTIMALSLALTTKTSKRTSDLYLYEQAVLYSKSAAELALLDIAENGCRNSLNYTFDDTNGNPMYDANVTMEYIYDTPIGGCQEYFAIATPEQNGSVLMDIRVSVRDINITTEPINYFRRTIQKL